MSNFKLGDRVIIKDEEVTKYQGREFTVIELRGSFLHIKYEGFTSYTAYGPAHMFEKVEVPDVKGEDS